MREMFRQVAGCAIALVGGVAACAGLSVGLLYSGVSDNIAIPVGIVAGIAAEGAILYKSFLGSRGPSIG